MRHQIKRILVIFAMLMALSQVIVLAADCNKCGGTDISSLAMLCPDCGAEMHSRENLKKLTGKSRLHLRVHYKGDRPNRLPPYGKVYINGEYKGNINLIESEAVPEQFTQNWGDGLGDDYSAYYEKFITDIQPGILKVEVEMRFNRFYGLARSFKRVTFPYVSFKRDEDTALIHEFSSAATFSDFEPSEPAPIPVVSEMKLQGASGTVALNVGLFK